MQVTSGGNHGYLWNPNGREIFYQSSDGNLMTVPVNLTGDSPRIGRPQVLFENPVGLPFDVSADGERFLTADDRETANRFEDRVRVVLNWFEEVQARTR